MLANVGFAGNTVHRQALARLGRAMDGFLHTGTSKWRTRRGGEEAPEGEVGRGECFPRKLDHTPMHRVLQVQSLCGVHMQMNTAICRSPQAQRLKVRALRGMDVGVELVAGRHCSGARAGVRGGTLRLRNFEELQ